MRLRAKNIKTVLNRYLEEPLDPSFLACVLQFFESEFKCKFDGRLKFNMETLYNEGGAYDQNTNTIEMKQGALRSTTRATYVLLHELRHWWQIKITKTLTFSKQAQCWYYNGWICPEQTPNWDEPPEIDANYTAIRLFTKIAKQHFKRV